MRKDGHRQLKPCPFCGGTALRMGGKWELSYIRCADCWAQTNLSRTQEEAEEAWNRRASDAALEDDGR
jgi:Lar family restriction alleviation protein